MLFLIFPAVVAFATEAPPPAGEQCASWFAQVLAVAKPYRPAPTLPKRIRDHFLVQDLPLTREGEAWGGWITYVPRNTSLLESDGAALRRAKLTPGKGLWRTLVEAPDKIVSYPAVVMTKRFLPENRGRSPDLRIGYRFHPLRGTVEITIGSALRSLTNTVAKNQYEPAQWVSTLLTLGASVYALDRIYLDEDSWIHGKLDDYRRKRMERSLGKIEKEAPAWDNAIQFDQRYSEVKNLLAMGILSPEDARQLAAEIRAEYQSYERYVDSPEFKQHTPEQRRSFFLDNVAFAEVASWVKAGLPEGHFAVGPNTPKEFDTALVDRLIRLDHVRIFKYGLIAKISRGENPYLPAGAPGAAAINGLVDEIKDSPNFQALAPLKERKQISSGELQLALQKEAEWMARLGQYQILDIARKKTAADGKLSNETWDLVGIRRELLQEVTSSLAP